MPAAGRAALCAVVAASCALVANGAPVAFKDAAKMGNPVWGSDFRLGMRVKQVTDSPEAFAAWLRYCTACVERYKDVVDEWGGVFAMNPKRKFLSDAENAELVASIKSAL